MMDQVLMAMSVIIGGVGIWSIIHRTRSAAHDPRVDALAAQVDSLRDAVKSLSGSLDGIGTVVFWLKDELAETAKARLDGHDRQFDAVNDALAELAYEPNTSDNNQEIPGSAAFEMSVETVPAFSFLPPDHPIRPKANPDHYRLFATSIDARPHP